MVISIYYVRTCTTYLMILSTSDFMLLLIDGMCTVIFCVTV